MQSLPVHAPLSLESPCLAPHHIEPLRAEFQASGYVELTRCFAPAARNGVAAHVQAALEQGGRRRDIRIKATSDSPRRYRLAGRAAIDASGGSIQEIYRHPDVFKLLAAITGEPVQTVPYPPEEYIATRFEEPGDTHGWHWDDYSFALIWIVAAADEHAGGSLEFIPNVSWNKADPRIDEYVADRPVETRHPAAGTVYLLRADTMLHRVTPLVTAARREILCLSYASEHDLARAVSHETLEQLYSNE